MGVGPESEVKTVLYVKDEESDALFMKRAFAQAGLGAALRLVGDGRAALRNLHEDQVHIPRSRRTVLEPPTDLL